MQQSPTPAILSSLLEQLKLSAPTLSSFSLKLPERRITIQPSFIDKLVEAYGTHLRKLAFLDCGLELKSIETIAEDCENLERLDVSIPIRETVSCSCISFVGQMVMNTNIFTSSTRSQLHSLKQGTL